MRFPGHIAFAGVSLMALSAPAFAQDVPADETASNEDIIVQARRKDESLQDVPLTVNAVSAAQIEKLNIRDLKDITTVVPGLVLNAGNRTTGVVASLRGLNVDVNSSGSNTSVQFYLNDSVISAGAVLQGMFDIGQVEVLRGPQGTLRGLASPSGSITITTKRPIFNEWGGYVQGTATSLGAYNANGAVNVPVIDDVLAFRVAGFYEDNESNRVRSIYGLSEPEAKTRAFRASVRFAPTDTIEVNASYNHLVKNFVTFDQIESAIIANPAHVTSGSPATNTFITARDRLAVENVANVGHQGFDVFNWQAKWSFAGQRLDYVGSFVKQDFRSTEPYDKGDYFGTTVPGDPTLSNNNGTYTSASPTLNAQNAAQATHSFTTQESHELRLSSEERLFGMFDYVAGLFVTKQVPWTDLVRINSVNPVTGAIGSTSVTQRRGRTIERAAFGNLTAHLGEATEVSGGIRFINYKTSTNGSSVAVPFGPSDTFKATIWTASIKHRFSDDVMVYATAGSSFRVGSGTNGLIIGSSGITEAQIVDPYLKLLYANTPERSKSYEIGLRSTLFDKRLMINLSAFHQTFNNYIYPVSPFYFLKNPTGVNPVPADPAQVARTISTVAIPVPAKVDGFEAEIAFRPSESFNISATLAYAKAKITNGVVPCVYNTAADAQAALAGGGGTTTTQVKQCNVTQSAGRIAPFTATVQSEYNHSLNDSMRAFLRGTLQIYGNSTNDEQNIYDDVPSYALLNLYAGVRAEDGHWELTAFAKNLTNTFRVLSRDSSPQVVNGATQSNYRLVTTTDAREFGLSLKYAFGSR